ncbi:hypothetical protein AQ490_02595 [Wenjunlia vitaminophila]|uniref:Histidine kinase/HSP90-like ATPase domain-containing protein n=1 Tax=Wenjunlia vitaminophila TaxID=76728 RepID=A0A0T6LYL9_WENVI|nr:ATP-binding protein [Wenjunlia vitaminophila]KRV51110.1 hypothetical protein AQ490_02595 [Wenjunlia vitaminophila]
MQLPRDPRAPRVARATLRAVLSSHGLTACLPDAELLTSEMVTNAVLHSAGPSSLRVHGTDNEGRVRVSVWDSNPDVPSTFHRAVAPHAPSDGTDLEADGGRGLLLVRRCAADWGGHAADGGPADNGRHGKLLWFDVRG